MVEFSNNINGVKIIGNNGTLTFNFVTNDMIFAAPSMYINNNGLYGNIIFNDNNNKSIIIN